MHWREYPNFVSTRKFWKFWIHLLHWPQYPNLRVRAGSDEVTKCARNFPNFRVLTKFGYSRQCTKCIRNFRLLAWLGYWCFRLLQRVISWYPSDGYYDISAIFSSFFHDKLSKTFRAIYCLIERNLLYKTMCLKIFTASGT